MRQEDAWVRWSFAVPILAESTVTWMRLHFHGFMRLRLEVSEQALRKCLGDLRAHRVTFEARDTLGSYGSDLWPRRERSLASVSVPSLTSTLHAAEDLFHRIGVLNPQRRTIAWWLVGAEYPVRRQVDHLAYDTTACVGLAEDTIPLIIVVALTENCAIDVAPFTHNNAYSTYVRRRCRLPIPIGHCVVLRGDLVHAGSPCRDETWCLVCHVTPALHRRIGVLPHCTQPSASIADIFGSSVPVERPVMDEHEWEVVGTDR